MDQIFSFEYNDEKLLRLPDRVEESEEKSESDEDVDFMGDSENTQSGRENERIIRQNAHLVKNLFNLNRHHIMNPEILQDDLDLYIESLQRLFIQYPNFWRSINIYIFNSDLEVRFFKEKHCSLNRELYTQHQILFIRFPMTEIPLEQRQFEVEAKLHQNCDSLLSEEDDYLFQFLILQNETFFIVNRFLLFDTVLQLEKEKNEIRKSLLQGFQNDLHRIAYEKDQELHQLQSESLLRKRRILENKEKTLEDEKNRLLGEECSLLAELSNRLMEKEKNEARKASCQKKSGLSGSGAGVVIGSILVPGGLGAFIGGVVGGVATSGASEMWCQKETEESDIPQCFRCLKREGENITPSYSGRKCF